MYGDEEQGTAVFETFLEGEEFSLMTFVNGELAVPSTVLHKISKRAFDHDEGPNTGGMGAYCPVPHISDDVLKLTNETINNPLQRQCLMKVINSSVYYTLVLF